MVPDRIISALPPCNQFRYLAACLVEYTSIVRGEVMRVQEKPLLHFLEKISRH